jgi:type IV pilus assembly protein PilQ
MKRISWVVRLACVMTCSIVIWFYPQEARAQAVDDLFMRLDSVEKEIRRLEASLPGLNEKVNISLTDVPLNEFLRAIANNSGLNMDIDPSVSQRVSNNFSDVRVSDVLIFLSRQFRLDITEINNILIVRPINVPVPLPLCYVEYNDSTQKLTLEVEGELLSTFLKAITIKTRRNVIPSYDAAQVQVNAFILSMPFQDAIDKMAYANNLIANPTPDGFILIEKKPVEKAELQAIREMPGSSQASRGGKAMGNSVITVRQLGTDSVYVFAENAQLTDVIRDVAGKCGISFILSSESKNQVNLLITGDNFDNVFANILSGSDLVLKKYNGVYIIGNKETSELMTQKVMHLQYRSVDSIAFAVPEDLLDHVELRVFKELNSVFLSGPHDKVETAAEFINAIDKSVPVISIELLIIDYSTSYTISTGIEAGISDQPVSTAGVVFPNVNITLGSQSINDLINRFNGFGWARIGQVTPNFYASLKMLENQGILKIRSTPILSTLNGHTAELSIGNTEYYLEESVNIIGTQNPQTATTQTYKPITAELAVIITPQVSGDDQITLEVEVTQSDFTERISTTAPPGQTSRTFKSLIRVKNGEMILLGGLEEKRDSKTGHGTPLLSRIPVIKWLFSSRDETNSKSKLNIFIKPTIIN